MIILQVFAHEFYLFIYFYDKEMAAISLWAMVASWTFGGGGSDHGQHNARPQLESQFSLFLSGHLSLSSPSLTIQLHPFLHLHLSLSPASYLSLSSLDSFLSTYYMPGTELNVFSFPPHDPGRQHNY